MRNIINDTYKQYSIYGKTYKPLTTKTVKLVCTEGNCYFIKKTGLYTDEKYKFLHNQGINNILYPTLNNSNYYVSKITDQQTMYYIMPYYKQTNELEEIKINHLHEELSNLHSNTYFKKDLSPLESRKKLEEIYNYLQYKFNMLESFVRTVESRPFDEYSIMILKDYQYILDAKKIMGRLNKKIIDSVKSKLSVYYVFIHNNPKMNHLINNNGRYYLSSIEKAKIGIPSLDLAKFYIEIEDININHYELINNYFSKYDNSFYYDYFCFLVLLYYLKSIVIVGKDYISSQSFIYASSAIKKFIITFKLNDK